nr:zinc finger BED domain-containing protein RICESLEEPER 2-like [Ipomoea batatas]
MKRMHMNWRDGKNKVDCGVYLMRHMKSYTGEGVVAWDCGLVKGDQAALDRLCWCYMKEICTARYSYESRVGRVFIFVVLSSVVLFDPWFLLNVYPSREQSKYLTPTSPSRVLFIVLFRTSKPTNATYSL